MYHACNLLIQTFRFLSSLKFMYSEKATKFCEISTVDLSYVVPVKSKVKILQNFVAFSEYLNFTSILWRYIQKILGSEYGKNTYIPCLWMRHNRYLLGKKVVKQMFTDDLVELISSLFDPIHPNNWIPVGVRQSLFAAKGQSDFFWHFLTGFGFFKKTHKRPKWF